jgi:RHS repeat-associated protein
VNGETLTSANRAGGLGFFWKQLGGSNSTSPLWSNDTVAGNAGTVSGHTWTPAKSVAPEYDEDGNLKFDGRWDYTWDAENRLTKMQTREIVAIDSGVPRQKLEFVYDSQGRRVSKTVSTSTDGTLWDFGSSRRYLYDGWNLIAEYSALDAASTALTLEASHVWGIDLSGSMQGAGGVGGLLSTSLCNYDPEDHTLTSVDQCFPSYDGNGNISGWIAAAGSLLARMDYSPFGQLIALYKFTGDATLSRLNFGFSTKFTDAESGLLYYGYRYYDPVAGRWISKDPIGERGGISLYSFLSNQCVQNVDVLGKNEMEINAGFGFSGHVSGLDSLDGFFADMAGGRSNPGVGAGNNGESLMKYLENSSKDGCCIKNLRLASHGGPNGLGGGGDIEKRVGFYLDKTNVPKSSAVDFENIPVSPGFSDMDAINYTASMTGRSVQQVTEEINGGSRKVAQKPILHKADPGAADIKDLSKLINDKAVKFCGKCEIHIHACYQSERFVSALAKATGCSVYYQPGSCMPGGGNDPNQPWTGSRKFKSVDNNGNITNHDKTHYPPKF